MSWQTPSPPLPGEITLEPCPFCGRPGRLYQDRFSQWAADCSSSIRRRDCFFARINGGGLPKFETPVAAAAAWNKRGPQEQKQDSKEHFSHDLTKCPIRKEENYAV